ncbi:cellulose biosynthesis protein BcsS [Hyphomicrobium sp.]|uniref:cellulose biosynthesis protein BcsS n=1 Tax=Hyphomicrobium sp. TaxID=82 RepID=UPI002E36608D|nr:cellulose biosynthesis protein BcsS [Hyphomicrobium sp.]HEX2839787.1 cellulose biosynthesis protein BcsS [Hyphomicrobium sp.]
MSSPSAVADEPSPGREVWAGADVSTHVWLVYSGVTLAPFGGIYDDGLRFRAAGGYGEYSYTDKVPGADPAFSRGIQFHAQTYYADLLIGYAKRWGDLTAKGFVGASIISHEISPLDSETIAIGDEVGVKGVIELWLNIGERGWGSLDLAWSSAHSTRTARARLGYRMWPKLSVGLEAGINVDSQGECRMSLSSASGCKTTYDETADQAELLDYARVGAFARYEWGRSEVSLSTGVLGDTFAGEGPVEIAPYVTVNWLTQF